MKKSTFALFLLLAFAMFAQEGPWFRDIKTPIVCPEAQMTEFTAQLRSDLLAQKPIAELLKNCPVNDNTPRVIFITLGDGLFPGRTYYSAGSSFQNALSNLYEIILKREPEYAAAVQADIEAQIALAQEEKRLLPDYVKTKLQSPNAWDSLRLDVVQAVLPIDDYVVNSSRLLLSSIVGIAFDQNAAFAFPPEQLTGRYLMTAERQLSVSRIGNLISEANLWSSFGLWLQMGAVSTPFKVTLFETDSYFADKNGAMRLFRAHPTHLNAPPTKQEIVTIAENCAGLLDAKGNVASPFPEWVVGRATDKTALFDQAALVYVLANALPFVADDTQKHAILNAMELSAKPLLRSIKHLDPHEKIENGQLASNKRKKAEERAFALLVEEEDNPEASEFELPARISELRANALAYIAFTKLIELLPKDNKTAQDCRKELKQMFRHISLQVTDTGNAIPAVVYPTLAMRMTISGSEPLTTAEELETAALAGTALDIHRKLFPEDNTKKLEQNLTDLWNALERRTTESLKDAPFSPYLALFMARDEEAVKSPQRLAMMTRLAVAAAADLEKAPMLPDMFGCDADIPSMTYAAERLSVISVIAQYLAKKAERKEDAAGLLQSAWPLWIFAQQAAMSVPAASVMPQPKLYVNFQRDNLADYGFTLNGQTTQLLARELLLTAMKAVGTAKLNPSQEDLDAWTKNWTLLEKRPMVLAKELVLKGVPGEENSRIRGGSLEGTTTSKTIKVESANLEVKQVNRDSGYIETKVLKKKGKKK